MIKNHILQLNVNDKQAPCNYKTFLDINLTWILISVVPVVTMISIIKPWPINNERIENLYLTKKISQATPSRLILGHKCVME